MSSYKIRARFVIKRISDPVKDHNKSKWTTYAVQIDNKKYDLSNDKFKLPNLINLMVHDDQSFKPVVGDQVEAFMKTRPNLWMLSNSEFNGNPGPYFYTRNTISKDTYTLTNGREVSLYRYPMLVDTLRFELKPVIVYFNPITLEERCETILNDVIKLSDFPDRLLFSIYEITVGGGVRLIGDWDSYWNAYTVFDELNDSLKVYETLICN